MRLKKFTKKDSQGNTMSFEFDVPPVQDVPHPGEPKGTDTVPAWLTPGEFVVNAEATRMFEPQIEAMNNMGRAVQAEQGGTVPTYAAEGQPIKYSEALIREREDYKPHVYFDSLEKPTVGTGHRLTGKGWKEGDTPYTEDELASMFNTDMEVATRNAIANVGPEVWSTLNRQQQGALISQAFQLGGKGQAGFEKMLDAVKANDPARVRKEAVDSDWYDQTPTRVQDILDAFPDKTKSQVMQSETVAPQMEVPKDSEGGFPTDGMSDTNKAAMNNAAKYLFMGDLVDGIKNIIPMPAEPTPELNVGPEYEMIEKLKKKGYTPEEIAAIFRNEDVPNKNEVPQVPKDVPQYTPQGAVGENMMGTKPGSLVSGMPQKEAPTVEVPEPAEVSLIPNSAKGFGYLLEGIGDALQMSPNELLEATKDAAVGGPQNRNVPKPGAVTIPDGAQADEYDKRTLEDASEAVKKIEEETIFGDIETTDLLTAAGVAGSQAIKVDQEKEKQDDLEGQLKLQVERGTVDPSLVAAVENQKKKVAEVEKEALDAIEADRKGAVKKAEEEEEVLNKAKGLLDDPTTKPSTDKPSTDTPSTKEIEKEKTISNIAGFKTLKQKKATPEEKKAIEQFANEGSKADKSFLDKATSTLKDYLGDMFDKQELGRMAVIFAGSQLMGYSPEASIQYAAKGYLDRVDSKAIARQAFIEKKDTLARFTTDSLAKYRKSGDFNDLVEKPVAGKPVKATGEMITMYALNGKGKVKAQIMEQDGNKFYVAADGTRLNPFAFTTDASKIKGTDEYNKRSIERSRDNEEILQAFIESGTVEGEEPTGLNARKAGRDIAAWEIDNNADPLLMGQVIQIAYGQAAATGKPVADITPFLEGAYITATVGNNELFVDKNGNSVPALKVLDALDQGIALVRQNPNAKGKSDSEIQNNIIAKFREEYSKLDPDEQAIYEKEAGKGESGFLVFLLSEIDDAQGQALGVY